MAIVSLLKLAEGVHRILKPFGAVGFPPITAVSPTQMEVSFPALNGKVNTVTAMSIGSLGHPNSLVALT